MYQWYYADKEKKSLPNLRYNVTDLFRVDAVRPTMWEEHCLECAAPECYSTCCNYISRSDGRCKLFLNSISVFKEERAQSGYGAHIKFRKWANMMSLVFQNFVPLEELKSITKSYHKTSFLRRIIDRSFFSKKTKWKMIHWIERKARKKMRSAPKSENTIPDVFVLHCFSYNDVKYKLIMEIYEKHDPKFRTSFEIHPGENLYIVSVNDFPSECWVFNNLVKIYPENNFEADIDFYWCDFVHGVSKEEKVKCVVWDLDNTLWDGVISEQDDASALPLREGVLDIIKELDKKGIIQSIASKNDYAPCWSHLEFLQISDYFLFPQINWGAKSNSIKRIASNLNIGLDSVVFFDDSIFEREEVLYNIHNIRAYDPIDMVAVVKSIAFDLPVTLESKKRRSLYIDEIHRKEEMESLGVSSIDFLKQCEIEIELVHIRNKEIFERCFELVQRTNQLNMSGRKYTHSEFEASIKDPKSINLAVFCKDKYGAYGISCYVQYCVDDSCLRITEYAMSCRIAEKYIEGAIFAEILRRESCKHGRISVVKTNKNKKLLDTFYNIGFVSLYEDENSVDFEFCDDLKNKRIALVVNKQYDQ